jgi:hypothetical protein
MQRASTAAPLAYASPLAQALDDGEQLVWSGRPRQGVFLRASDAGAIPFSLMWGGFAIFWEAMALTSVLHPGRRPPGPVAFLFPLWGVPFVLIGLYIMVGRFFVDAWRRRRTWYGVTDRRAVIVAGGRTTSFDMRTIGQVDLQRHRDGTGTITFGIPVPAKSNPSIARWGTAGGNAFDHAPDAEAAYRAIRQAQNGPGETSAQ